MAAVFTGITTTVAIASDRLPGGFPMRSPDTADMVGEHTFVLVAASVALSLWSSVGFRSNTPSSDANPCRGG